MFTGMGHVVIPEVTPGQHTAARGAEPMLI